MKNNQLKLLKLESYIELLKKLKNRQNNFVNDLIQGDYDHYFSDDKLYSLNGISLPSYNPIKKDYKSDHEFAIAFYESLSSLTRFQATDKRLWSYLTMFAYRAECYNFGSYDTNKKKSESTIRSDFFYEGRGNQTASKNLLSKLYWAVKQTLDEELKDKYYYTKLLIRDNNSQLFFDLTQRSRIFNRKELLYGYLLFMEDKTINDSRFVSKFLQNHLYNFDLTSFDRLQIQDLLQSFYIDLKEIGRGDYEKKGLLRRVFT